MNLYPSRWQNLYQRLRAVFTLPGMKATNRLAVVGTCLSARSQRSRGCAAWHFVESQAGQEYNYSDCRVPSGGFIPLVFLRLILPAA